MSSEITLLIKHCFCYQYYCTNLAALFDISWELPAPKPPGADGKEDFPI